MTSRVHHSGQCPSAACAAWRRVRRPAALLAAGLALAGVLAWLAHGQHQQAAAIEALQAEYRILAAHAMPDGRQGPDGGQLLYSAACALVQSAPRTAGQVWPAAGEGDADPNARAVLAALAAFMARTASLEAAVVKVQGDLASLNESMVTVRDQLGDRLTVLERHQEGPPLTAAPAASEAPPQDLAAAIAAQGDDVQALAALVRTLSHRSDTLNDLDGRLSRLEQDRLPVPVQVASVSDDVPGAGQPDTPAPPARSAAAVQRTEAEVAALREAAIQAFQTLDSEFQAILERLDRLAERDRELDRAQEATMVALQTQLSDWRERHSPPVWDMAAQLAGLTIRFSEATRYADPGAAQAALQQVSSLVLASDPSLGVRVVGYADFDGTDALSNRITSQKRADAVRQQLVSLGVPEGRLLAVGRSTEDRVIDSDAAGNANRRAIFEPFLLKDTE